MSDRLKEAIGIIISTYNSIDNLNLVLEGYRNQTDLNFILYIADDGSDAKTAAFIKKKSTNFPAPIQHIWHEDSGFRLSAIRNRAIHQAKAPYLIITDGDCIPFPGLVAAHRSNARLGSFVTGGRLLLSEKLSHHIRTRPWPIQQEPLSTLIKRVIKGEINRIIPLLLPIFCTGYTTKLRGLRGCHLAFWRKDLLQVDGFDESYKGWGREDSDIACRLFHAGITRRTLRGIPLLHLWHAEATRSTLDNNDALLTACIHEKRIIARQGISSHGKQETDPPHDDKKYQPQKTISNQLTIVQICRRFGPVGGMERYVWELSRELAAMGHHVHVLCEVNLCTEPLSNVHIHELGEIRPKPRWLAHIRFSHRVHHWLQQHRTSEMIIHSHERTQDHHISTFHGPPFAKVRDFPLWKRISLRIKMNLWLEQRELCATQVQMIVPNSMHIANDLRHYYPSTTEHITAPIVPGVTTGTGRPARTIEPNAGVIGFVGKEWQRKGLVMAIAIVSKLAETRPNLSFIVAGPVQDDICQLFKSVPFNVSLLGKVDTKELYSQFDVLLHPASNEPFGMVVTEALSCGVPVVISDVCGAASEVTVELGNILCLTDTVESWCEAIDTWLSRADYHVHYQRSWHDTARAYVQSYQKVKLL